MSETNDSSGAGKGAPPDQSGALAADTALVRIGQSVGRLAVPAFRRHAQVFVAINAALTLLNIIAGGPWWAFWPLLVTGFLLGAHYLVYKGLTANEQWAEERAEELNLKSYDRSHIEDLKTRYGDNPNNPPPPRS
ncbi:MAG: 2TM domain-containing protein [Hyphomicrobiaceae bacterium]